MQTHNKTFHARTKPRKSTPVHIHGRGAGSMPRVQQPPPVGRAVAVESTKQNTTPPVRTFSTSVKNVSVPVPLKTLPIEHSNGSEPQAAITDKEVKKPNSNSKEIECPDSDIMYASDIVFVCHVCKECFSKPQFVRDHQAMVHVEYKFACSDRHCLHIFKIKCGQKRHWDNKYYIENEENGSVVVKQEDNGSVLVKQEDSPNEKLNVSNISNISGTSSESANSRGSKKKKISDFGKIKQKEIVS